jgi:hypothetical protein
MIRLKNLYSFLWRRYPKKHFDADLLAGLLVTVLVAWLMPC